MEKQGRAVLYGAFHRLMRRDPKGTVRNVCRDLYELVSRAAGDVVFVTCGDALFHLPNAVPRHKRVFVLDATENPELLRPRFAPRPVEVLCDWPVRPAGRVVQFMDFNGPRSYLNLVPSKLVRIIDALGDLHPVGTIVLISHGSCVDKLAAASRHYRRITTAYFGALRGRNDLEPAPGRHIACHIVAGSPKTTEEGRRQLALAVFGRAVLPFDDLVTVRRAVTVRLPHELVEGDEERDLVWEVRVKGYADQRMQAVYEHTVTAELTQAADRARVLIHPEAVVYLVANEPCPGLWFTETCLADDLLDLSEDGRADFRRASGEYETQVRVLLEAGKAVGNADVCRALERKQGWGKRYWSAFLLKYRDALEGERKVRWKGE